MKTKRFLAALLLSAAFHVNLPAQEAPLYERGATYSEYTMPPSPGPASVVKYADVPFSHSAGLAEYDVPFYTLEGRELSIPIGLHYASGGIKLDEIAGVAGLGWNLEAGGCITRTVMDMPDEFTRGSFRHEMPSADLLSDLESQVENDDTMEYLRNLLWHRIDGSLDRYSYNVCGLHGSFVIQDDGTVFQFSGDGVEIDYTPASDGSVDSFTLTGPDGTVYILSEKEVATHRGRGAGLVSLMDNRPDSWSATTAWHITQVHSYSGTESAVFTYTEPEEWENVIHANRWVTHIDANTIQEHNVITTSNASTSIYTSHLARALSQISLNGHTVFFTYAKNTGSTSHTDMVRYQKNFPFRLTGIRVRCNGNPDDLSRLDVETARAPGDGRIILTRLHLYHGDILDDSWDFNYRTLGRTISRGSQDWYGYYNGENEYSDSGTSGIAPYIYQQDYVQLANGYPNPSYAAYMSLDSVNQDGAVTQFEYEGNNIPAITDTYSVGIRVKHIITPLENGHKRIRSFTYELPVASGYYVPSLDMYTTVNMDVVLDGFVLKCSWEFTIHDSPVTIGPSIRDTRIYYGKVVEDVGEITMEHIPFWGPQENTSRTIHMFNMNGVSLLVNGFCYNRFPSAAKIYYDGIQYRPPFADPRVGIRCDYGDSGYSAYPVLTRKEVYAYEDDSYNLVSSYDYTYDSPTQKSILVDYHVSEVMDDDLDIVGNVRFDNIYHFPIYARSYSGRNLVKEVHVNYHASGNDTTVVNRTYTSRMDLSDPARVKAMTTTENGIIRTLSYEYADTWIGGGSWVSTLAANHFLSQPLKKSMSWWDPSKKKPSSIPGIQIVIPPVTYKEEVIEYDWQDVNGTSRLLPSAHKEFNLGEESWSECVLSRDIKGNISSFKEKGRPETVILWGYKGRYPVAVIENATISTVVSSMGGQNVVDGLTNLASPSQTHQASLSAMRRVLADAHVTTYSWLPGIGVTTMTDPAGITTTYEYDHAGRLTCVRDSDGNKVEEYSYSLMTDEDGHKHMNSRVYRSADGQDYSEDVRWWDKYGRRVEDISIDASGDGRDLVTAYGSDFLFHDDVKTWLPYPAETDGGLFQDGADASSALYHGSDTAYVHKGYELSSRDLVISSALPGYAGVHETRYGTDVPENFLRLEWESDSVCVKGTYASDDIVVEKTTDADGRLKSVYKDHRGRVLGTSNGDDEPTYHVYDKYDRLCAVVGSGIELTDTLNMWRYSYDSLGRLASKGIPSSVREHYEYDSEDRVVCVRRGDMVEEYEYDAFGRVLKVYRTVAGNPRSLYEGYRYDTYPSGVTGSNPKGMVTQSRHAEMTPDGSVLDGFRVDYSYDDRHRPVKVTSTYRDGSSLVEDITYTFSGEVQSKVIRYYHGASMDELSSDYVYDVSGRLLSEASTLRVNGTVVRTGVQTLSYDDLGRADVVRSFRPGGPELTTVTSYSLQGWTDSVVACFDDQFVFMQGLGYDCESDLSSHDPQYAGLVTLKNETWFPSGSAPVTDVKCYGYDYAGRLTSEKEGLSGMSYTYDSRGNMLTYGIAPSITPRNTLDYSGDRLTTLSRYRKADVSFSYDTFGRMTYDGLNDVHMEYNAMDLVRKVTRGSEVLVNYSYLADGTKLSALDVDGEGLVYRGPFVYRQSSGGEGDSSLTFESASFGGGLLTSSGVLLYVKDYLGSVRAVLDADSGALYKAVDYSAYGDAGDVKVSVSGSSHPIASASLPSGLTLRDGYTGKEDQHVDFGTGYVDFGARQYSPALHRWLVPDPLSEKFYGISPYAFCNSNPMNYVDVDGEFPDIIWDLASIGMGAKSLVDNVRAGNTRAAIGDGVGIVIDAFAAAVPFVPGGVGALRTGAKLADMADDVVDAARGANCAENVTKAPSRAIDSKLYVTYTKKNPVTGEVYSGRTSGYGDPRKIVAKRDSGHHMNKKGFEEAQIDRVSTDPDAIRGREQYLIDLHGGAKSQGGTSGNAINGISQTNPNKQRYVDASEREYGWQH